MLENKSSECTSGFRCLHAPSTSPQRGFHGLPQPHRHEHGAAPANHKKCCRRPSSKDVCNKMSHFLVFPNITKYSCLAQIILKTNHLQRFCFVQYRSLKPLLQAHTCTRRCPLKVFLLRTPPGKKHLSHCCCARNQTRITDYTY